MSSEGVTSVTKERIEEAMRPPEDHILYLKNKGKSNHVYKGRVAYKLPLYIEKVKAKMEGLKQRMAEIGNKQDFEYNRLRKQYLAF